MHRKDDFITNSSSTSFIITNLTNETKTLLDFAEENLFLLEDFNKSYNYHINKNDFLDSVKKDNIWFDRNEEKNCVFGDESGTLVGRVYDYILRKGGKSPSFEWKFDQYYR